MKQIACLILTLVLTSSPALACNEGKAREIASQPLPEKPSASFDVKEQQSVEGGTWEVYNGPNGKPQRILRTDYGETGRVEHRLTMTGPGDYLIMKTRSLYSAPIFASGATVREEIDYVEFCGRRLETATEGEWAANTDYEKLARESVAVFFEAPEVAAFLKAAGIKPPLWK